jgi:PAS domain-containing protein
VRSRCLEVIAHGTLSGSSLDEIITDTVHRLHDHFSDVRVAYSTLDEESLLTVHTAVQPESMPDITGMQGDLSSTPEYLDELRREEPVLVRDVLQDPRVKSVADALAAGKTRALLDVPLVHRDGVTGLLCLDAPAPRAWSDHEVATLTEVARYLSLALKASTTQEALEASARTHRELAEQLAHEHWRLERIIESTNVGTWEWNVQTGETVFNETWAELAGFTLEELEPVSIKTWLDLVHPDDAAASEEAGHSRTGSIAAYREAAPWNTRSQRRGHRAARPGAGSGRWRR